MTFAEKLEWAIADKIALANKYIERVLKCIKELDIVAGIETGVFRYGNKEQKKKLFKGIDKRLTMEDINDVWYKKMGYKR